MNTDQPKKIITIEGLEGHPPTSLSLLQQSMLPQMDFFIVFWWVVWTVTLLVVLTRSIINQLRNPDHAPTPFD